MDRQTSKRKTLPVLFCRLLARVHTVAHQSTKAAQDQPHYSICSVSIIRQKRKAGRRAVQNYQVGKSVVEHKYLGKSVPLGQK